MTQYFQGGGRVTGTGTARATFTPTQSPFADVAARDTWAAANLSDLHNSATLYTLVEVTNIGAYQWSGLDTPASYTASGWVFISESLTAPEVKALYESNPDTNALVDDKNAVLNTLSINTNRLVSEMSLQVPPGTIYIGTETSLSASIRALHIRSNVTGNNALLLAQLFDDTSGFGRAFVYSGDTIDTVDLNDPDGTDTAATADFTITTTADELVIKIRIDTSGTQGDVVAFVLQIRTVSVSGPLAVNFAGNVTLGANGVGELDLTNTMVNDVTPILVDSGTQLFIHAECVNMTGTQVDPTTFRPNAEIDRIVVTRESVALLTEIPDTTSDLTNDSGFITGIVVEEEGTPLSGIAGTLNFVGSSVTASGAGPTKTITIADSISGVTVQDEGTPLATLATTLNFVGANVEATGTGAVKTITISTASPPQATHTNYIDVTVDSNASSVDIVNGISSDDLNPTVTLEVFTGNRYIQILQSQAHTVFTSIVISGINQIGGFTVNENARTISGQAYRQYVTTNLITDALSGAQIIMGGAT